MGTSRSVTASATATLDSGSGFLLSFNICAGADAATAVLRSGGSGGTVIGKVGAAIGLSAERQFIDGVPYTDLHVTITGTTPVFDAEIG